MRAPPVPRPMVNRLIRRAEQLLRAEQRAVTAEKQYGLRKTVITTRMLQATIEEANRAWELWGVARSAVTKDDV